MNLEHVEQTTLLYLKQVSNPLVRIGVLHQHLSTEHPEEMISLSDLHDFLDKHELFKVMNPLPLDDNPSMEAAFSQAGFASEPCVLLETRIPTEEQVYGMMLAQLDALNEALSLALREARDATDTARVHAIGKALERVAKLRERIVSMVEGQR